MTSADALDRERWSEGGWWLCDPAAAVMMVAIISNEGVEGIRGEVRCDDCRDPSSAGDPP